MRFKADRLVPPGFDGETELGRAAIFLGAAAAVFVFGFAVSYMNAWQGMYVTTRIGGVLRRYENPEALFAHFRGMTSAGRVAFVIAIAAFLALGYRYVSYHYKGGTRCAYTMRRLPHRWEFYLRCLAVPLGGAVLCEVLARLMTLAAGLIYVYATPERWLPPGSWEEVLATAAGLLAI